MTTSKIHMPVGQTAWPLMIDPEKVVPIRFEESLKSSSPRDLATLAVTKPFGFDSPLSRALTPEDHVAVVLDEGIPHLVEVLVPVLEQLLAAGVPMGQVTLVVPAGGGQGAWLDDLPDELSDVKLEVHDPEDKKKLAYLATTKSERRVYLNRSLVEAEFVVVVTRRGFDPTFGYSGAETAIFPRLSEPQALVEAVGQFTRNLPGRAESPLAAQAAEIAWLLGTPFFVQVIEGPGDTIHDIVGGLPDSCEEGIRRLEAVWRGQVAEAPELVIASISGDPARISFQDLGNALLAAARIVAPGGRIALLTTASPTLDEGAAILRQAEEPDHVSAILKKRKPDDWAAADFWAFAAKRARLYIASPWPDDVLEEFFATPIRTPAELQRLTDTAPKLTLIPDAHKTMVRVGG
ncbi:MAG: lactate racemase domain-containing protein [Fimbriiglobus sp.]